MNTKSLLPHDLEKEMWLFGEVCYHVGIYESKAAEGLSAFYAGLVMRSCDIHVRAVSSEIIGSFVNRKYEFRYPEHLPKIIDLTHWGPETSYIDVDLG